MATFKKFEDIKAWQKARELNKLVGSLINDGRFKHNYRLIQQIEGSAGSIMDNIAEGYERNSNKEFLHLYISKGSCGELRSQLYRALDRSYINDEEFTILYNSAKEIIVMIQKLIDYLKTSELKGVKYKTQNSSEGSQLVN